MDSSFSEAQQIWRWREGEPLREDHDELALEEPLEIRVRGRSVSVTMRTPGPPGSPDSSDHDAELAAGFLLTEGLIRSREDLFRIEPCARTPDGNIINVFLAGGVEVDFDRLSRHIFASSSCGVCGKASIEAVHAHFEPLSVRAGPRVRARTVLGLPEALRRTQAGFDRTGGLHAAAVFDAEGKLVVLREDVGRHNAVDKVVGYALLEGLLPLDQHVLLVSGRASFEIMQKALAARLAVVAAVSAPSSLAADFARQSGQTLVGFLRAGRMNVYAVPERIVFDEEATARRG